MARPVRIEYAGAVYHVICRGNNRQAVFRDDQNRMRYLEKLSLYLEEKNVDLLAYCFLSNHVISCRRSRREISPMLVLFPVI